MNGYRPQLDSLRAFAVGIVLIHHFLPVERIIPADYITLGFSGVRLFFVLSGFLITGILLRARGNEHAFRRFYFRRILRIFPIYYLTLAIGFAVSPPLRAEGWWMLTYTSNFIFPFRSLEPASHFWTLAVEEQFYLIWPFLILLLPYRHLLKLMIVTIALALAFRLFAASIGQYELGGVWLFGCLDSLGLGGLLAYIQHDSKLRLREEVFLRGCLITGGIITSALTVLYVMKVGATLRAVCLCFGVSLIFAVVISRASHGMRGRIKAIMEFAPVVYVGRISYGLYVYHYFMPKITKAIWGPPAGVRGVLTSVCIATFFTFAAAILSWHLIEKPISRLKELPSVSKGIVSLTPS